MATQSLVDECDCTTLIHQCFSCLTHRPGEFTLTSLIRNTPHMAGALFTFFNLSGGQVCAVSAQQPEKMFVNASRGCMLLDSFHAWDPCFSTLFGFDVLYVGLVWTSQH